MVVIKYRNERSHCSQVLSRTANSRPKRSRRLSAAEPLSCGYPNVDRRRLVLAGDLFDGYLVKRLAALSEGRDVGHGRLRNVRERFRRKECLVTSNEYVWECEEPREDVVADEAVREVLEKEVRFLLIDVESEAADNAVLEPADCGTSLDYCPRLVLISIMPRLNCANVSTQIIWCVSGVSGQCRLRMSARAKISSRETYVIPSSSQAGLGETSLPIRLQPKPLRICTTPCQYCRCPRCLRSCR